MSDFDARHVPVPELIAGGYSLLVLSTLEGGGQEGMIYLVGSGVFLMAMGVLGAVRSSRNHHPGRAFAVKSALVVAAFCVALFIPDRAVAAVLIAVATVTYGATYYYQSVRSHVGDATHPA